MASPGHTLDKYPRRFGKYHLLGPLAQGGMGALYLAVTGDRGLERMMVIKTVLPHLADAEYVARFRDEAKVVVKLSHGNLIPVFDAGQVNGELFLAMDFVEGRDLRAIWNRCARERVAFPVDIAVYVVKELCRGLAYAHAFPDLQLVHRDISPPNILVSYTGEVKLTDFGLASSTLKLEKTAPGIIYGKVAYMSPEQARGEKLDGRSDQYAIAIVLWELLTGRQLFPPGKEQPQDLLTRARNPEVLRPSRKAPRVPAELDDIVVRALSAEKDQRYPTCDEMRQALQGWLAINAPTTDSTRMSDFLRDLFADDIVNERTEREAMLSNVRRRAMTLPPTDELRQILEKSGDYHVGTDSLAATAVRTPGSVGRRSADRGDQGVDRRKANDRRGPAAVTALMPDADPSPTDSQPILGMIVDGRYRVVELIGEGGMGKVYLAEHIDIGKKVALKVLHPSYSRMPDLVERFRREARAASKIGHPHIVDVTDSGTTADGSAYFVMEFLQGVELGSVIEREGALEVGRAVRITQQICRALAAAHTAGIIHRDLKPENVFLTIRDGTTDFVKVLDFGIAKTTEAEEARERKLTSPGMAMGTPEYMAPEQAAGRPADARCDVYALGAILYEMLTGVPPYQGDNFMEILTKKATVDPVAPIHLRSTIPAPVSALVAEAMARNPDDRPATMEAFEYELTKCMAGRGTAVAQILGMSTDQHLVASLNPGLSGRTIDSGVFARPTSSPALMVPRTQTPIPGALMASPSTPTSSARVDVVAAPMADPAESLALPLQRAGWATAAWTLLGLGLAVGVGVILFVAAGERRGHVNATAATAAPSPAAVIVDAGVPPIDAGKVTPGPGPGSNHGSAGPTRTVDVPPSDGGSGKPRIKPAGGTGAAPPATLSEADAAKLLAQANDMKDRLRYAEAKTAYEQVIASGHYRGDALVGLAWVYFQTSDVDRAIDTADKAVRAGAGDTARKMLGHFYFKKGFYDQALVYYQALLKAHPKDSGLIELVNATKAKLAKQQGAAGSGGSGR
ncbi:MAG: protein kinase [Myxococcales bacterium]|nr:protein kinase [Myxococcales bacterium]